jgi:hypothetical protein
MAFSITLGSISISINLAASVDPVIAHPGSVSAVYATFGESVVESGLTKTVFDAFPAVIDRDNHAATQVPWPSQYGTSDEPYGTPADPETGVRAVTLIDDGSNVRRWTNAIHTASKSRKSLLQHYADLAFAIATGIKSAMESSIRTGRVTFATTDPITVNLSLSATAEIFITPNGHGFSRGAYLVDRVNGSLGSFTLNSDGSGGTFDVSWLVVG